jgi:hypothetical protein
MSRLARGCAIALMLLLAACAEPPIKEMNQAQGAIDAARAAGAEQYAADEFRAAVDALRRSEEAVTQNDHRLALSLAIDSRERAQSAAKLAVEARSKARGDAERVVAEARARLTQAHERLKDPAVARLPRRTLDSPTESLDAAQKSMQEASAALAKDDYGRAQKLATDIAVRVQLVLEALGKATAPPASRQRK